MISKNLKQLVALFLTVPLLSCQTLPIVAQHTPDAAVKAIPCVSEPVISFHAPVAAAEVLAWMAGGLPDPQNKFDTPGTVQAIRRANAARSAVCGP